LGKRPSSFFILRTRINTGKFRDEGFLIVITGFHF
jgi:hypothetical protein